jgi:uncharacterized protein with FMN-binding domain
MNHMTLKQRALPLTFAALTAGSLLSAQNALAATTKHTYKGTPIDFRWGTLQVSIVVKNKKITNVKTAYSVHTSRSEFITGNAIPELKQEVLQAQSASIDTVSRATDTSEAYMESLQVAVQKAVTAKTLSG